MSRRAEVDQGLAELLGDPDRPAGFTLLVNGTAQSHVDLDDPTHLEFEYVRWLGHVVDTAAPGGRPLNALHLGGGAWTLARYLAVTRPGSRQRVVENDARLVDRVRDWLPSPQRGIRVRIGDAREVLTGLTANSADLIVVDVFAGARTPAHLTSQEFVAHAARVLRADGRYAVNLADGDRLAFARSQIATVTTAFRHACLLGPPQVLRGRRFGNLVLVAGHADLPLPELARRAAAEPFGVKVLSGEHLSRFAAGAPVVTDHTAVPSQPPPAGLLGHR